MASDRRGQLAARPALIDGGAARLVNPCRSDPVRARTGSRLTAVERRALAALFLAVLVLRVVVLWRLRVNSDEPQHLHVVWAWTQGLLPYRDVFDNHMPLFHILSIPAFLALGERPDAVLWMRLAVLPLWGVILLLTARIGRTLFGPRVGPWSAVVAGVFPGFFFCSLEYRPDVLWTVLWLAAIALAVGGPATPRRGLALGLVLGTATVVSLKTVLMLLAIGLATVLTLVVVPGSRRSWLAAAKGGIAAVAGLLLAPGLVMLFFAARGAFDPFLYGVLWHNLVPGLDTGRLTAAGTLGLVLALAPIVAVLVRRTPVEQRRRRRAFVMLATGAYAALLWGSWPVVTRQDMLPALPPLAMFVTACLAHRRISVVPWSVLPLVVAVEIAFVLLNAGVHRAEARAAVEFSADVLRLVPPGQPVLDPKGETVFRPRAVFWVFESITRARLERGLITDDFADALARTRTRVVAGRIDYLPPETRRWVQAHYLPVARHPLVGSVRAAGARLDPVRRVFDVGIEASYVLVAANGTPSGLLDGRPYDGPRILTPGLHSYRAADGDDRVALLSEAAADQAFSPFDGAGGWR